VDLSGWVGVGLGGNCDCRCGILYGPVFEGGGGVAGLFSLTSSPCSSEISVLGRGGWSHTTGMAQLSISDLFSHRPIAPTTAHFCAFCFLITILN